MGNVIESFAHGFGNAVGKLFSSPIEFLSGKSCSSVCGPTWDLVCYIENFCIANLLRLAMAFVLLYGVLLFLYLLHKLGIFGCIGRSICKAMWACCSSCCCICEYACTFFCVKLHKLRKRRRRRRFRQAIDNRLYSTSEEDYSDDESLANHFQASTEETNRSFSRRRRDYKGSHLRKSLRPKSDRARVEISRNLSHRNKRHHSNGDSSVTNDAIKHVNHKGIVHDIKVTRTSKFARKGILNNRKRILKR